MDQLKKHLKFLDGRGAHVDLGTVLEGVPDKDRNSPIEGLPYTLWELLEHIRLAQKDILEYMVDPDYEWKNFPDDYWPKPGSRMNWEKSVNGYQKDLEQIKKLVKEVDLLDPLPYGEKGHTYLREVLILDDHLSYHLGQMVTILRLQGAWD